MKNKVNKQDLKFLMKFYREHHPTTYWYNTVKMLADNNNIKKIYRIYENGFLGAWFLIVSKDNKRYVIKHTINDVNTSFMMQQFYFSTIDIEASTLSTNQEKIRIRDVIQKHKMKRITILNVAYEDDDRKLIRYKTAVTNLSEKELNLEVYRDCVDNIYDIVHIKEFDYYV